jgi:hypothetical protein
MNSQLPINVNVPTQVGMPINAFDSPGGTTNTSTADQEEIKRLRLQHALYKQYKPLWDFYLSAYEGGTDFTTGDNLFRHVRENEQDYQDRVQRLHNINYCEPLVDFFTNFIFSESIDRSGGSDSPFYTDFISNVNKRGDSIDDFMRQVSDDMQIFGMSYIQTDAPQLPTNDAVITKQTEKEQGIRPYWVLIKPQEILDWVTDEFGNFIYVKRVQIVTEMVGRYSHTIEKYTEFYNDRIEVSRVDITDPQKVVLLGSELFDNPLKTIPIEVARYKRSKKYDHIGLSFLKDFAFNNREIMNLTSLLQEFLYRQAFNILARQVQSGIPLAEQEDGVLGSSNVMDVPADAKHMPQYISPPADPAKFIQEERSRIKNEMFVRASQDALNELFNGEKSSGFSQAQSFAKTVPFISSRADALERVENKLMALTMKLVRKEWSGKVKYKDRYELTNLTDALTQLITLGRDLALPSETFMKEELKRMIREYDGKLPIELLAKAEKEVDQMDFKAWQAMQKEALVGKAANSPGDQQKPKSTGTMAEVAAEAKVNTAATKKVKK